MNLPKKLEKLRDESSEKYGGTVTLRETRIRRIAGFNSGFNAACELLLPEIEKMRICLEHYANEELWFEATCLGGPDIAKETLKQWQEFVEG